MTYLEAVFKVLVVGLVLGAGLPAVFAAGLVSYSRGAAAVNPDGTAHAASPALRSLGVLLFTFVGAVILLAILWITRTTIIHHTGVDLFPFLATK